MFDKTLIPTPNPSLNQLLANLYTQAGASTEQKASIEKKIQKISRSLTDKINNTVTISQYFDQLWSNPELKEEDKEYAIRKLEALKEGKKEHITRGLQGISKTPANLDVLNAAFQTTPFEDFNYQAKIKDIKKRLDLNIESDLFKNHAKDLDILYAVNRPARVTDEAEPADYLHYTGGLYDIEEAEIDKKLKAEEFVKKIKDDKKAFARKMKQIEQAVGNRELEEMERIKKEREQEEEERLKDKKKRLEAHIKELNARSEARLKESTKWEEDYKIYLDKKPMFKEMEDKYKRGYSIPQLEERKKKLQEIRDFHKPISKEDLLQHEQKINKILEERNVQKKEQDEASKWDYQKPAYESKHHKTFADELSRVRKQKEDDHTELLKRKEKISELMQNVKEKHMPKVDHQKEMELMGMVEKLKKRKDIRAWTTTYEADPTEEKVDPKKLGVEYLKVVRELNKKKKEADAAKEEGEGEKKEKTLHKNDAAYATAPVMKKHNYLADLRKENKIHTNSNQVDLIIKNKKLDQKERKELLQSEIEKLEEKAKRKEMVKKYKIKKGEQDIDDDEDVDQIYINAIKAKLQILGN